MPSYRLSGKELMGTLSRQLEHGQTCLDALLKLYDHPKRPLFDFSKIESEYNHKYLKEAAAFVEKFRASPDVEKFKVENLPQYLIDQIYLLSEADKHISRVAMTIRYVFREDTYWDKATNTRVVGLSDTLDHLTNFDDSE